MSNRHASRIVLTMLGGVLGHALPSVLQAAPLYWDTNGATPGLAGGAGAWSSSNWSTSSLGDVATGPWVSGSTAVLTTSGAAFTVSVDGDYQADGITFGGTNHTATIAPTGGVLRTLDILGPGSITVALSRTLQIWGVSGTQLRVTGNLEKLGDGNILVGQGTGSFTQFPVNLTISAGTAQLANFDGIANSPAVTVNGGNLRAGAAGTSVTSLDGPSGLVGGTGANNLRGLLVSQTANTTYSGVMVGNPNAGGDTHVFNFEKANVGLLRLDGNLSHDGFTKVTGGTLLINGSFVQDNNGGFHGSDGNVTVGAGATLGGNGSVKLVGVSSPRSVVVSTDGTLAPGDPIVASGVGTFTMDFASTTGGFTAQSGAKFSYDLAAPGTGDLVRFLNVLAGDVTLNANVINFNDVGGLSDGIYTLMAFYSDDGTTLTDAGKPTGGLVIGTGLDAFPGSYVDYSATGLIQLVVPPIPEPSVFMLLVPAAVMAGLRRR